MYDWMDWKSTLKLEFQPMFLMIVPAHCIVMLNILTVTDENHEQCIVSILQVNVEIVLLS